MPSAIPIRILLSVKAESDLDAIHDYYCTVAGFAAADEIIASLLQALRQLQRFPGAGRPSVMPDIRELVLARHPFVAPYRMWQGQIQVLRILHQRTQRPEDW